MFWLELLIQFVIYSRIIIGLVFALTLDIQGMRPAFVISIIGVYLLLTEFLPFLIILVGVCYQFNWNKEEKIVDPGDNYSTANNRSANYGSTASGSILGSVHSGLDRMSPR
jgi:hypothetical protein